MKAKYKKFSNTYMVYLHLRHIYGDNLHADFKRFKAMWGKIYKIHKERSQENPLKIKEKGK